MLSGCGRAARAVLKPAKPNNNRIMKQFLIVLVLLLALPSLASATDLYVSPGGSGSGCTLSNLCSLGTANSDAQAGDTIYMKGGNYGTPIQPARSGSSNSNRIVYRNYNSGVPTITGVGTPIVLSNRNYITVLGITTTNTDNYLTMNNGAHNEIAYCKIGGQRGQPNRPEGFHIGSGSSYNWIHHNDISEYGYYTSSTAKRDLFYVNGNYNLIEDNQIYWGGHNAMTVRSARNLIRNNLLHNEEWYPRSNPEWGKRVSVITDPSSNRANGWNLVEGNRYCFAGWPPDRNAAPALKIGSSNNIVRKNIFYHAKGAGIQFATLNEYPHADYNYIYNNVFFYNGIEGDRAIRFNSNLNPINGNIIINNILYENILNGYGNSGGNTIVNNWEDWNDGNPGFVDAVPAKTTDPFDWDYPDFRLSSTSNAINAGAFLTTTRSAGSGTQIPVQDAHYFFDGWGMAQEIPDADIQGDLIQLEGQTQTARITNINYNTNTITVDTSLSWTSGQGLSLAYKGSKPDMGAFEFGSGQAGCSLDQDCSHLGDLPCIEGFCDDGTCIVRHTTNQCNDGISCTENDACSAGACLGNLNDDMCTQKPECNISTCTISGCVYSQCPAPDSLILNYDFNEGSGPTVLDSSSNGLDGDISGAVWSHGHSGTGLEFDGQDDFIDSGSSSLLELNNYTLIAWIYQEARGSSNQEIMEKADSYWMNVRSDTGLLRVGGFYGGCSSSNWVYLDSSSQVPLDQWVHVAVTYDGAYLKNYIDGKLSASAQASGETCKNQNPLAIGAKHVPGVTTQNFFNGVIDEVRLYQIPLTESEISEIVQERNCHRSDKDCSCSVEIEELFRFIDLWKSPSGGVAMPELMEAIGLWKGGTGCVE
jgi:hypothetical protein